jgi:hypothetical protein
VQVRLGLADPLANRSTQLVSLLFQLPHPLRLHGEIATNFDDPAFDNIRQFGGSAQLLSPRRAANNSGLRHSIPLTAYPDRPECRCLCSLERNDTIGVFLRLFVSAH